MLARRFATAFAAALLAALLATVATAPAATVHVPSAHLAQDGSDDTTQLDLGALPVDSGAGAQDCTGATDGTGDGSQDDLSLGDGGDQQTDGSDPVAGSRARMRDEGAGVDDPNADLTSDASGNDGSGDGSSDTTDRSGDGSSDTTDPSGDGSGDTAVDPICDTATTDVAGPSAGRLTIGQTLSSGAVDTGSVVFQDDGIVERELDLVAPGAPRAAAASKRAHGKARKRGLVVLAKVDRKVAKGQKVALKPKLTPAGRKALKAVKAKQVKILVTTRFRPKHGRPRTYRKTLTLYR